MSSSIFIYPTRPVCLGWLLLLTFDGAGRGWSSHGRERRGSHLTGSPTGANVVHPVGEA